MSNENQQGVKVQVTFNEVPVIEFQDDLGKECTLCKTSYKPASIHLGADDNLMVLSQNMVKVLLPYLKNFSEKGELL